MNQTQRKLLEGVIASLDQHPHLWRRDQYRVEHHNNGLAVWVGNGHCGLSIQYGWKDVLGGVTGWSSFFGPLIPWRARLRKAAMGIYAEHDQVAEKALAALTAYTS